MRLSVMARHVALAAVGLLALGAVAVGGQAAASAPGQQPRITVSPSIAAPGDTVTFAGYVPIAGDCGPSDARLTSTAAFFPPDGFGPGAPRDANGDFSTSYAIPADTAPGTYQIGVRCGGGNVGISTTLEVTQAAPTTASTAATTPSTRATPATTVPTTSGATTTAPPAADDHDDDSGRAPWIVAGVVVVLLVAGAAAVVIRRRRRAAGPGSS